MPIPNGFSTNLFQNISLTGTPQANFGQRASGSITAVQNAYSVGSADPLNADSDSDGMPDGWEIWFARWNVLDDDWTLNPMDSSDRWEDADDDGMANWEEYNSIDPLYSETDENRSSPQWFVTTVGSAFALQKWLEEIHLNIRLAHSLLRSKSMPLDGLATRTMWIPMATE